MNLLIGALLFDSLPITCTIANQGGDGTTKLVGKYKKLGKIRYVGEKLRNNYEKKNEKSLERLSIVKKREVEKT